MVKAAAVLMVVGHVAMNLGASCAWAESGGERMTEATADRDARMQWWREARFGMFIHWGPYAVPAGIHNGKPVDGIGEWIMNNGRIPAAEYEAYAAQFNPTGFDADAWAQIAADAGMRYIVITAKHHDGFGLWDSTVSDYDVIDASPFQRDVLQELAEACAKRGIRFCLYYSIMDWHHPDAQAAFEPDYNHRAGSETNPNFERYVRDYMRPQLLELIASFEPGVLWFDGEWIKDWTEPQGKALYDELRRRQPALIVNNRVGKGRQGMEGMSRHEDDAGDFGTPEQEIPATGLPGVDWESCMTMNDTWGHKSNDDNWKSVETLVHQLVDCASKGGNFLLNVGPTAEGVIPSPSTERLAAMGDWLRVNGEAIYGTTASPFDQPAWGRYTAKGNVIYAHVFDWPDDAMIRIPSTGRDVASVYRLGDAGRDALNSERAEDELVLHVPPQAPDPIASVIAIEFAP